MGYTALAMESESVLATELQDLSKEYGLSSESETGPSDDAGTLNDYGPDILDGFASETDPSCEDGEVGIVKQFLRGSCGCKIGKDGKQCTRSGKYGYGSKAAVFLLTYLSWFNYHHVYYGRDRLPLELQECRQPCLNGHNHRLLWRL